MVEATHVPSGTPVKVIVKPQAGTGPASISDPTQLAGPSGCVTMPGEQCMSAPVTVPIAPATIIGSVSPSQSPH